MVPSAASAGVVKLKPGDIAAVFQSTAPAELTAHSPEPNPATYTVPSEAIAGADFAAIV